MSLLRNYMVRLGGKPSAACGVWSAWARRMSGGNGVEDAALAILEEGEGTLLASYLTDVDLGDLDPDSLQWVNDALLPGQEHTHAAVCAIKKQSGVTV